LGSVHDSAAQVGEIIVALCMQQAAQTKYHPNRAKAADNKNQTVPVINQSLDVNAAGKLLQI
jgi:hypothetical protein